MEQLQLLSVLVNHEVTADIARGFWAQYIAEEYGDDVEIEDDDRYALHSFLTFSSDYLLSASTAHTDDYLYLKDDLLTTYSNRYMFLRVECEARKLIIFPFLFSISCVCSQNVQSLQCNYDYKKLRQHP